MKAAVLSGIIGILALITVSYGQQTDGKQFCQSIVQCYEDVVKLVDDCQKGQKPANASSAKKTVNCQSVMKDKQAQLHEKQIEHEKMVTDCVKSRTNEALMVPAKQADMCQGSSQSSGDGSGQRNKRQASVETSSSPNITSSSSSSTDGMSSSSGGSGGGGSGGGSGSGRGGKGKGKGQGNGQGKGKGNECQKKIQQKRKQCDEMKKCCSEVEYCEQKYEVSDLHDQVHQLQLDILDEKHKCVKEQQNQSPKPKPSTNNNNVMRDSPIEDDDDEAEDSFHDME